LADHIRKNLHKQRIGIKGRGGSGLPLIWRYSKPSKEYGIPLVILGVNDGKQQVMTRLGLEQKGQQYFHFPVDDSHIGQRGYDQIYFKGIIAEQRKVTRKGGMIQVVWEPISKDARNEPLDLRVYNLACMKSLLPHINWVKIAEMLIMHARDQRLRRDAFLLGAQHDWRAVRIVGADVPARRYPVFRLHFLEAHPDIGLDIFDKMAEMDRAVGVRQGGSDENFAGHDGMQGILRNWQAIIL